LINIDAENIGKKFKNEWIFKDLSLNLSVGNPHAIIGPNGSGKSTLMQSLTGIMPLSQGKIYYKEENSLIEDTDWYSYLSFSSPYMELIEEFTLFESVLFHCKFRPLSKNLSVNEFLKEIELFKHKDKQVKFFSSGMRQKLKLALAFYSLTPILFLDEPTSNLDIKGYEWYKEKILEILNKKVILISSNEPKEYIFCNSHLNILDYKV
jgi:ABC-type multidrug transport system ATPase subunit